MLFNSYAFLLGFLPITALGYFLLGRRSRLAAMAWLMFASFVFYGWWNWRYVPLLVVSILFNFHLGSRIARQTSRPAARRDLVVAVGGNLLLLAYFKYTDFLIGSLNAVTGAGLPLLGIVLPLGISFFTFTQIAFLADAYQGKAREYRFVHYALFVTYFPHLIAGPILHHKEMMPQFDRGPRVRFDPRNFEVGLSIFAIGLAKKVLIADNLARFAAPAFADAAGHTLLTAWAGVLAYGFQLYFDFSGYSDMAIGISRLFGIKLPLNFNSPYKAADISDFWRRWHMTLSRFLRDYLYIPLGGNRHGSGRRYVNLIITMGLGGLWHGAGWGFALWGLLHGCYLAVHHACRALRSRLGLGTRGGRTGRVVAVLLTFLAVNVSWVLFRAPDVTDAFSMLRAMSGMAGVALPDAIVTRLGPLGETLQRVGVATYLGGGSQFVSGWLWIVAAGVIVFFCPNTQEIMRRYMPALQPCAAPADGTFAARVVWRRTPRWAVAMGLLSGTALLSMSNPSEFLYFQF